MFVTEFNARVNWIWSATRVRDKPGYQSLLWNFMHFFKKNLFLYRFSKKCYVDLCFMWNPWTNCRLLVF